MSTGFVPIMVTIQRSINSIMNIAVFLVATIYCVVSSSCINDSDIKQPWALGIGEQLPQFSIEMTDGTQLSTADLRGSISVIILFETSCIDCQQELPEVNRAYQACKDTANFIAISREEDFQSVLSYWQTNNFTMPFSAQKDRTIYNKFATFGVPRVYISDAELTIIAAYDADNAPDYDTILNIIQDANKNT